MRNDDEYKKILMKLLNNSIPDFDTVLDIIDQIFNDNEIKEQAFLICENYFKPEYFLSKLVVKEINIRIIPTLFKVCKEKEIGFLPFEFNKLKDDTVYNSNEKLNIFILSGQETEFNDCLLTATALSGINIEMKRILLDKIKNNSDTDNAVMEIKNVSKRTYQNMKKYIQKLPYELKFTIFPEESANGYDIAFFTQTEDYMINHNGITETKGPYSIPKLMSVILFCSLISDYNKDSFFIEQEETKKQYEQILIDLYNTAEEPFYLVPVVIKKNDVILFNDKAKWVDFDLEDAMSLSEYKDFIKDRCVNLNEIYIPMSKDEFLKNQMLNKTLQTNLNFLKDNDIHFKETDRKYLNINASEKLIDMLNRKREQIMLMSDDFNNKNMENLANYVFITVQEIIIREDNDYLDFNDKAEFEELQNKTLKYIHENVEINYAYDDFNAVKKDLEIAKQEVIHINSISKDDDLEL